MQQYLSYLEFDTQEIVLLSLLFVFLLIQIFFYFKYYSKPLNQTKYEVEDKMGGYPKVSIIISSENEAERLAENLPMLLEQDYPDYEVIIVNNGSTDESYELLQSLKLEYNHLYHTYVPNSDDKGFDRRKLALTLGAKAAKSDILLFTEPFSRPVSDQWITSMIRNFDYEGIDVVLGYSFYAQTEHLFNRVARYDNHLFSMQYLSMAIDGKPYTGVYRNVAFRKSLFFANKGFAAYLGLENGEDLFVNQVATSENTIISLSQNSFVKTTLENYSHWRQIKKSYSIVKALFKGGAIPLFSLEYISRYLFYITFAGLCTIAGLTQNWVLLGIAVFMFLFRFIMQLVIINKSAKYFYSGKFHFSLLLVDILQPIYNFRFRTRHRKTLRRK